MYSQFINRLPKWRDDLVEPLEIPERISVTPYVYTAPDLTMKRDFEDEFDIGRQYSTASSASSLALSRAMTDSEIDYELYRRIRNKHLTDPWYEMRTALDSFSPYYLDAVRPYMYTTYSTEYLNWIDDVTSSFRNDIKDRMETFFDEQCRTFDCDDPGLLALAEALESLDLKSIYSDIEDEERRLQRMYLIDPY